MDSDEREYYINIAEEYAEIVQDWVYVTEQLTENEELSSQDLSALKERLIELYKKLSTQRDEVVDFLEKNFGGTIDRFENGDVDVKIPLNDLIEEIITSDTSPTIIKKNMNLVLCKLTVFAKRFFKYEDEEEG
jgi:recombinational DNA repair ATPase RecF